MRKANNNPLLPHRDEYVQRAFSTPASGAMNAGRSLLACAMCRYHLCGAMWSNVNPDSGCVTLITCSLVPANLALTTQSDEREPPPCQCMPARRQAHGTVWFHPGPPPEPRASKDYACWPRTIRGKSCATTACTPTRTCSPCITGWTRGRTHKWESYAFPQG